MDLSKPRKLPIFSIVSFASILLLAIFLFELLNNKRSVAIDHFINTYGMVPLFLLPPLIIITGIISLVRKERFRILVVILALVALYGVVMLFSLASSL